ncbi:bile acid:sodium symporter family protein [Sphaerochaeta sp. PS]|uniref:bile acid:sodium symporter family protein n=1 Tax=Sphaerochaeta sp. PS TaxID=3076336 RepID=UPI0028A2EBCB|nr:bile acid:sodium symporter family protein [Sphaerochaeta sp. PS]MDT4763030.1 bile acid:sodium symporter family protein [Sphaerochaeta sp. PS]
MPILTPTGVIVGLLLGSRVAWMKPSVTWLFAFLTFSGALGISSSSFLQVIKKPKNLMVFFLGTNIIMPIIAWALASLLFGSSPDVVTGYVLLLSIPTAVSGYIWSAIYNGNGALSLTLILLSTLLAPILTPHTVSLLTQSSVTIQTTSMMLSLLKMVVIPSFLGVMLNTLTKGKVTVKLAPSLKPFSKIALFFVIIINISQIAERLIDNATWTYLPIALLSAVLTASGYPIAYSLGKLAKIPIAENKSITFATSMRNISAALVLSIEFFPAETALPVIFGIVFQQTVCAFMGHFLFGEKQIFQKNIRSKPCKQSQTAKNQ